MTDDDLVRRLLADARHDEPMPADVADRLHGVITSLQREDDVVPLTAARDRRSAKRRPWLGAGLVAAAAAVVVGVGIGSLGGALSGGDGAESTSGAAESASDAGGSAAESGEQAPGATTLRTDQLQDAFAARGVHALSSADLLAGVRRLVADLGALEAPTTQPGTGGFPCAPADWGPGDLVPVLLDGAPAVLAVRPANGDERVADVLECGTGALLRSVTVPVG